MSPERYEAIGGEAGCRKLVEAFYARLTEEPVLVAIYPKHPRCAIEALTWYLQELTGGPCEHSKHTPFASLYESHLRFRIGGEQRDAWLRNMSRALNDTVPDEQLRADIQGFFADATAHLVNSPPPGDMVIASRSETAHPAADPSLWDVTAAMEEVVAACRAHDFERAKAMYAGPALQSHLASCAPALVRLLAVFGESDTDEVVEFVASEIDSRPDLVGTTFGRDGTLLQRAVVHGAGSFAKMLIARGARADFPDFGGHCPLYHVANATGDHAAMVPLLVGAGADVNANGGAMRCTALHMAARRGNVAMAAALLDAGAQIDARDSRGVTPLGRALNCRRRDVADVLLARGADGP